MFVLTKKQRLHRIECPLPVGSPMFLTFREMTEEEREQFDLDLASIRNVPGDKPGDYGKRLNALLATLAARLLVEWEGVADEDRKPIEATDENKALFMADAEARKFWRPFIYGYLWPDTKGAEVVAAEGKQGPDPRS